LQSIQTIFDKSDIEELYVFNLSEPGKYVAEDSKMLKQAIENIKKMQTKLISSTSKINITII